MNIQRWITHCDTIWDIFKNPILMRIVAEWYRIKKDGKKLTWKRKSNGNTLFTPEYYEFIREIFEDRTDMESFLQYLREVLLTNDTVYEKIKENYSNLDIIKTLLSFDELNDQLSTVDHLTVSWVFQTKIINILRNSYSLPSHDENPKEGIYPNIPVFYALEQSLNYEILPISSNGEIISIIDEGNSWYIVSVLGEGRIFEVDKLGTPLDEEVIVESDSELLDTRKKIIERIELLKRIISHHHNSSVDLSEEDEQFYIDRQIEFAQERKSESKNLLEIHFRKYLTEIKNDLEELLKKMWPHPKKLELVKSNNWDSTRTAEGETNTLQENKSKKKRPILKINIHRHSRWF